MVNRKSHDSLGRRSRMKPHSTGKRIRLTDRDLLWMQKIHEHGPLSTSELLAFSDEGKQNKGRAQNRLTDLFNEDNNAHGSAYLDRPPQQFQTIDARYNELIYTLTKAGEVALKEAGLWSDWVHRPGGPFWHQRLTAIANIPLIGFFIYVLISLNGASHQEVVNCLSKPWVAVIMLLVMGSGIYHMKLGMQVVIEDYVHGGKGKALLIANTFFAIAMATACGFAILKLGFGG